MDEDRAPLLKNGIQDRDGGGYSSFNSPGSLHPDHNVERTSDVSDIYPENKTIRTETEVIPTLTPEVKVYTRRFYILILFSFVSFSQGLVWNTWGPISQSAKRVFDWTDSDIALLANWGPISFIVSLFFFSWVMDVKGLRWSCISCSFVVTLGAAFRCISFEKPYATWLIHTGQLINGFGGPVAMAACTIVSATWFPPNERTTSTSIGTLLNALGVAASFIIGPQLVTQENPDCTKLNSSSGVNVIWQNISGYVACFNGSNATDFLQREKDEIAKLMYIECGFCVFLLLALLLYFPSKPPSPPSTTASIKRKNFKAGLFAALRHRQFWIISSVYGICSGVMNCWMSILDVDLNPLGISQDTAGWMGFYSILAGTVCGLAVARGADMFAKHMKLILVILYTLATGLLLWLALVTARIIPTSQVYVWVTVVCGNAVVTASVPILYELSCEATFPVSEAITTSLLALYNNVGGLVFLFIMMIPNIGVTWTNWCVLGTVVVSIPLLILFKDNYNRLDLDIEVEPPDVKQPEVTGSINYSSNDKEIPS